MPSPPADDDEDLAHPVELAPREPRTPTPERDRQCCKGQNDCKGLGGCAVAGLNACAGRNECKGKGGCAAHCPH